MKKRDYRKTCRDLVNLAKENKNATNKELAYDMNVCASTLFYLRNGKTKLSGESLLMLLDKGYLTYKDIIYTMGSNEI